MKYEEAIKLWAAKALRERGTEFASIENAEADYTIESGCPTCGSSVEFSVDIWYIDGSGKRRHTSVDYLTLGGLLKRLFEMSA
jgi:hypothetical protein